MTQFAVSTSPQNRCSQLKIGWSTSRYLYYRRKRHRLNRAMTVVEGQQVSHLCFLIHAGDEIHFVQPAEPHSFKDAGDVHSFFSQPGTIVGLKREILTVNRPSI